MSLYSDISFRACETRVSNYLLRFSGHFDQYRNSRLVRSVPLSAVVWC